MKLFKKVQQVGYVRKVPEVSINGFPVFFETLFQPLNFNIPLPRPFCFSSLI